MKVKGNHTLSAEQQQKLINLITPYTNGASYVPNIKVPLGSCDVVCNYSKQHKSITVTHQSEVKKPTTAPPTPPQTPAPQLTLLEKALKKGTVTKNNNWYTYKGKNYNGKAKITAALS